MSENHGRTYSGGRVAVRITDTGNGGCGFFGIDIASGSIACIGNGKGITYSRDSLVCNLNLPVHDFFHTVIGIIRLGIIG